MLVIPTLCVGMQSQVLCVHVGVTTQSVVTIKSARHLRENEMTCSWLNAISPDYKPLMMAARFCSYSASVINPLSCRCLSDNSLSSASLADGIAGADDAEAVSGWAVDIT